MAHEDGLNTGDLAAKVGANAMNYEGAKRRSSYRAFIKEPMEEKGGALRQHLRIALRAQVERVEFEEENGAPKAVAVHYRKDGQLQRVAVGKELIFCAGALETPRLLMLSGVGEAAHLQAHDIPVVCNAPGVGQNLQDHPNVALFYRGNKALDFSYPQVYAFDTADGHKAAPQMCWVLYAAPASMQQAMQRMLPIIALPEFLRQNKALRWALKKLIDGAFQLLPVVGFVENVFAIVVILGKPTARGQIRLQSADPAQPAAIDPGWYGTQRDRDLMERGIERARQMVAQPSLAGLKPKALSKGAKAGVSGKALWKWIGKASMTTYHFAGSCRMGDEVAAPVAPADLRVKGLANVRVMDASLMPEIPVSALNAPSMMLGWRGAQILLNEYGFQAAKPA
jgi:choline dehydrogenase